MIHRAHTIGIDLDDTSFEGAAHRIETEINAFLANVQGEVVSVTVSPMGTSYNDYDEAGRKYIYRESGLLVTVITKGD